MMWILGCGGGGGGGVGGGVVCKLNFISMYKMHRNVCETR